MKIPATCSTEGVQSIPFICWNKKQTHELRYLDTKPVEMPNLTDKSTVLRFSLNLVRVKKNWLIGVRDFFPLKAVLCTSSPQ